MESWTNNNLDEYNVPKIVKIVHLGDFIQLIYEDHKVFGGFITTLSLDGPKADENNEKIHILGISTTHPNHEDEKILWASKIKQFRIIHK